MRKINVYFDFKTEKDWIDFVHKLFSEREFVKCLDGEFLGQVNNDFNNIIEIIDLSYAGSTRLDEYNRACLSGCLHLTTRSKKTLSKLNDWIKDNHYKSNYVLKDNGNNKLRMKLDKLLMG